MKKNAYRAAVVIALAAILIAVWINGAFATEEDNSGGLIFVPSVVAGVGACLARLRPLGMSRALQATTIAQAFVAIVAMIAWGEYVEFLILNGFFMCLWISSALLFRRAASDP